MNTLIILGNGFDLDLGFRTSYKDFFHSDYFPFVNNDHECHELGRFLYEKGVLDKWYHLEELLAQYGVDKLYDVDGDKEDYNKLKCGLERFLKEAMRSSIPNPNSVAARILKAADDVLIPPMVYSFNYTGIEMISSLLQLNYSITNFVHGSLVGKNIVLGVSEYADLQSEKSFLYKTSNLGYDSKGILDSFEHYDTVIIFGLSLSRVDYPYFEDFFKDVSARKYVGGNKKYIRLFTYDEGSRIDMLNNLRGMNRGLIKLFGYSDFDIIRTKDDMDEAKVRNVIEHLLIRHGEVT